MFDRVIAIMACYLALLLLIGALLIACCARCRRERRRLEKVLHDYNTTFEDDYKPF